MSAEQLLAKYPTCQLAVAFTELILCQSNEGEETSWELMMRAKPTMTLDEVLQCIQESMDGETACKAQEALPQTYTPEYRAYLAGKMGMY